MSEASPRQPHSDVIESSLSHRSLSPESELALITGNATDAERAYQRLRDSEELDNLTDGGRRSDRQPERLDLEDLRRLGALFAERPGEPTDEKRW